MKGLLSIFLGFVTSVFLSTIGFSSSSVPIEDIYPFLLPMQTVTIGEISDVMAASLDATGNLRIGIDQKNLSFYFIQDTYLTPVTYVVYVKLNRITDFLNDIQKYLDITKQIQEGMVLTENKIGKSVGFYKGYLDIWGRSILDGKKFRKGDVLLTKKQSYKLLDILSTKNVENKVKNFKKNTLSYKY